jgi:hypothetical protein
MGRCAVFKGFALQMELQMIGDENTQPNESVVTLESLAASLGDEETALPEGEDEADPEGEEAEESGEDVEEGDESEESAKEYEFTVKHDGKETVLKLNHEEVVESIQKSLDYTKKTMALAEERKAIEPLRRQAEELRQQQEKATTEALDRVEAYAKFLETQVGTPPPIEWAQQDAAYYLAQKELHETKKGQLKAALEQVDAHRSELARQRQASLNARAEAALKSLESTLPGWSDALIADLSGYLKDRGLRPDTHADAFVEAGLWELAHKAKAYDALQAEKAKLKPVKDLPKVHKPGSNQPPQFAKKQEALKAYKAQPSLDRLAALL